MTTTEAADLPFLHREFVKERRRVGGARADLEVLPADGIFKVTLPPKGRRRETRKVVGKHGGPGRTRTCNQAVMSR
jgi:hypothetical protein